MGTMIEDLAGLALDTALVAGTAAFAVWLDNDENKRRYEPDKTWLEVVVGCTACLAYASLYSRATGHNHERAVWRGFALGGTPVIVGEVAQWRKRLDERKRYEARRNGTRPPPQPVYVDLNQ